MTEQAQLLIDVRTREEYDQGHLAGAINVPHLEIPQSQALPADKNQAILVYCQMGGRAQQASHFLANSGYTAVKNLGGLADALEAGFELEV